MTNNNDMIIHRIKGMPAQEGTPESDADPRNPNVVVQEVGQEHLDFDDLVAGAKITPSMTLAEALALLQPPPGYNTILSKEAIDLVCNAARATLPALSERIIKAIESIAFSIPAPNEWTPAIVQHCVALRSLLAENARLKTKVSELVEIADNRFEARRRAEADANRLAEAARQISKDIYISDYDIPQDRSLLVKARQLQALVAALAEHDKAQS